MTDDNTDNYDRTKAAATVGELLPGVTSADPPMLGYDDAWWDARDRAVAEQRARDAAQLERQRMIERAGELRDNGFPEMCVAAALGQLSHTQPMRWAQLFIGTPSRLLVLAGGVGTGKTTAATWVALKGQDPRPGFMRISELERRGRYDKKLDQWLKEKTSLVIDDVGAEVLDGKRVFESLMDEVVDIFYSNRRTIVMTTNLRPARNEKNPNPDEPAQFKERYGERVWSRLGQIGVWGDCGVRDLRKERP